MKLLFSSLIASLIGASAVHGAAPTLAEKWQITDPVYAWDAAANKFDLDYAVSTFITQPNPSVVIYDGQCGEGGTIKTNGFTTTLTGLDGTVPDTQTDSFSANGRLSNLDVTIDPQILAGDTDLYTQNGDTGATIVFCIRYSLSGSGFEVNFLESLITMDIDLSSGFDVDAFQVAPKDKIASTADVEYNVEAKLCVGGTGTTDEIKADPPADTVYNQGSLITVCVYPDAAAAADGIVMNNIDNYTWRRQDPEVNGELPAEIYQDAITTGGVQDPNGLTTFANCNGNDVCVFDSILFAQFYQTPGDVTGDGEATLQFSAARRALRTANGRKLQEQDAEAAAAFGMTVGVNALDDGPGMLAPAGSSAATMGVKATVAFVGLVASALLI